MGGIYNQKPVVVEQQHSYRVFLPGEVAEILGVSKFCVLQEIRRGRLEAFKISNKWRITERALEKFMGIARYVPVAYYADNRKTTDPAQLSRYLNGRSEGS